MQEEVEQKTVTLIINSTKIFRASAEKRRWKVYAASKEQTQ